MMSSRSFFLVKTMGPMSCQQSLAVSDLSGHLLASVLLVKIGETCAVGSNVRMNGRGSSPRKNSSGVMNLMPTLLAISL